MAYQIATQYRVVGFALLIEDANGTRTMAVGDEVQNFELTMTTGFQPQDDFGFQLHLVGDRLHVQINPAPLEELLLANKPTQITVINDDAKGN